MSAPSTAVWKHIGLRSHSVGTLSCEPDRIVWKSALTGDDIDMTRAVPASQITAAQWTVFGRSGHVRLQTKGGGREGGGSHNATLKHELRFDGFPPHDFDALKQVLHANYKISLKQLSVSAAGAQYGLTSISGKNLVFRHCVLDDMNEEGQEFEPRAEDEMLSLDLAEVSQCVLPGNNRNEIELQFPESDTIEAGTDQLVAIRMYIPPDPDADPADKDAATAAEELQQRIMQSANIRKTTGDVVVSFDQSKGTFLTPRGRYQIELYDIFVRLRGQKYDYKIKYEDISRLYLLPKPDEVHMAFVIGLDKPIRQGQQRYQYLVLQVAKENDEVSVNLDEEALQREYNGELQQVMRGSLANLIAKTFKVISKKKVFIPGKFANANQQACVKCAVRANEGLLYPLEKQFIFIHKPTILIKFNEIESVEFQRYAGGQGSTRNFDLQVNLVGGGAAAAAGASRDYTFSGIDRSDYQGLYNFLSSKKIAIKNIQGDNSFLEDVAPSTKPVYNEDEIFGGPVGGGGDDEEGSEDESYDEAAAAKEEAEREGSDDDSDDMDSDEMGSEVDEALDSDLDEVRKTKRKGKSKRSGESDEDNDDNDSDDDKPKKKAKKSKANGGSPPKKAKAKKDPKAPKRATTAYFVFSADQRERVKKENPDASVTDIAKLLGAEWKQLSAAQKSKYDDMAKEDKKRYEREMKDYVPPAGPAGAASGKGKGKEAKKDPNAPKRAMTSFFFFSNEMRPKIKEKHPNLSFGDLGKKMGEMFRELTPEQKEKYEKLAQDDKLRFKRQTAEYSKSKADSDDDDDSDADGIKEDMGDGDSDSDDSDGDGDDSE